MDVISYFEQRSRPARTNRALPDRLLDGEVFAHRAEASMQTVQELMTSDVVTLEENDDISFADTFLRLGRIRHLPVVKGSQLVGLITSRDVVKAVETRKDRGKSVLAKDVMTTRVATVRPETPLREAARLMLDYKYGCLPVLGRGDALVGILTEADFIKYVVAHLSDSSQPQPAPA